MAHGQERELISKYDAWMALDRPSKQWADEHVNAWLKAPGSPIDWYLARQVEHSKQARTPDELEFDSAWDALEKVDELKVERGDVEKNWKQDSKLSKDEKKSELERIDAAISALMGGTPATAQTAATTGPKAAPVKVTGDRAGGEINSVNPTPAAPGGDTPTPSKPNWRHLVQAEAWEHWLRLRSSGCNPSVYSICTDMERWCAANKIKGDKGQDPKAGTIRNTVLGAGHWTPPDHSVAEAKAHLAQTAQKQI